MPYCHRHGPFDEYEDGCPKCRDAEKQEVLDRDTIISELSQLRDDAIESASTAAYLKNNPGDYECPSCGYITLKYCRNRCPQCQADVPDGYWTPIIERERSRAEAARKAQEEWDRGRKAAARKAQEEWERGAPARKAKRILWVLISAFAGLVVCYIPFSLVLVIVTFLINLVFPIGAVHNAANFLYDSVWGGIICLILGAIAGGILGFSSTVPSTFPRSP